MDRASNEVALLRNRRAVLCLLIGVTGTAWAGAAAAESCVDPKEAGGTQGMRQALNYKERAPDPKRNCSACAFFTASNPAACGKCALLSGSPVAATGVCDSWAAKS